MKNIALYKKAEQARLIYEDLQKKTGFKSIPTTFIAKDRRPMFDAICNSENPFPGQYAGFLTKQRMDAVEKLFSDEIIPQTSAIAAVLSACSSVAAEIGSLRGEDTTGAKTYCDISFAGLQAIRLHMSNYTSPAFQKVRFLSAAGVLDALNGALHKYTASDGRMVSFHAYYMSQQRKLVPALGLSKKAEEYTLGTTAQDMQELAGIVSKKTALELEELSFECGACGCMLRSREEWEASEVGKAVVEMPLIRTVKKADTKIPAWGTPNERGPLSGIKVLDLTHIIAGPACSRILAEYGADVLLVRRGTFLEQEQAMNEFDGWAGKHSIQLDFNVSEQLSKAKELIKEADIVIYSYQNGALDKFGLSEEEIRALNPDIIYADLMCFSDSGWKDRPGCAPCAEDITGLSVRNGSLEHPVNLNGVPLDYFPGFILALGTLLAISEKLKVGGGYRVTTSLTRGAQYLHECADLCEKSDITGSFESTITEEDDHPIWDSILQYVDGCSIGGESGFPGPATFNTTYPTNLGNFRFTDGNSGWQQ